MTRLLPAAVLAGSALLALPATAYAETAVAPRPPATGTLSAVKPPALVRNAAVNPIAAPATFTRAAAGQWGRVWLPFLWPTAVLTDIAAAGPSDVWITGVQGAVCVPEPASWGCLWKSDGNPVARRWNGSAWQEYTLPGYTGNGEMSMVTAAAPDDVWVAADFPGQPQYLARFDGSAFTKIEPPLPNANVRVFAGKSGTWLTTWVGNSGPGLYRRVAGTWQAADTGIYNVQDIQARTATDAWAVGRSREGGPPKSPVAHWDGKSWQPVDYPRVNESLTSVLPVSATDVWATVGTSAGYVVRWNGSTWSQVDLPTDVRSVTLTVDGSGTVWAGGEERVTVDGYTRSRPVLMSYTGGAWHRVAVEMPWGSSDMGIRGLTSVPGTNTVWVAANSTTGPVVLSNG